MSRSEQFALYVSDFSLRQRGAGSGEARRAGWSPGDFNGCRLLAILIALFCGPIVSAADREFSVAIWPDLAPGETSRERGEKQPYRAGEDPPVTRITKIRQPTLDVFLASKPNGVGILVLPGGGFGKVVPDKEGSEAAPWLARHGISTFVLRYRTNEATPAGEPAWKRPLQDAQRALRLIRQKTDEWRVQPDQVGVLGFSAGGQVASILHTRGNKADYEPTDAVDSHSCRPDFSLLIYPWRVTNADGALLPSITSFEKTPPAFLVHTHDDGSTSLGAVLLYAGLKRAGVPAEIHVFENGGHGYGMRPVAGSNIGTWPRSASDWLTRRKLARPLH